MKFSLVSRKMAQAQGMVRFYTGNLCKYGHDSQRYVTTGGCVACNAARSMTFSKPLRGGDFFSYPVRAEHLAEVLAFCQAKDLEAGHAPYVPRRPNGAEPLALPADIARHRAQLLASYTAPLPAYLPKP